MGRREARRAWTGLLAPPTIWFAHFGFVYAAASLEIVLTGSAGPASRLAIGLATLAALGLIGWYALRARHYAPGEDVPGEGTDVSRFWVSVLRILAGVSAVGVLYQAMPALLV